MAELLSYKGEKRFFDSEKDKERYLNIKERTGLDIDFIIDHEIIVLTEKLEKKDLTLKEIAFFFKEFKKVI